MQKVASMGKFLIRCSSARIARLVAAAILLLPVAVAVAAPAAETAAKIAVFPTIPYYAYIIYESLVVFWVGILGLLVIIRMKLREIERVQELDRESGDPASPLLQ
jgi:hypothetical protein